MMPRATVLLLLVGLAFLPGRAMAVSIYAAASTTDAIEALAADFEMETGQQVTTVFAGSGTLARQIDQGAPADIFLSANPQWTDWLQDRGKLDPIDRRDLLSNHLTIITPAGTDLPIDLKPQDLESLLGASGRLALADPNVAPAGKYAVQALTSLNLWPALKRRTVMTASVRAALAWVERGEVPAAITYVSDVRNNPTVKIAVQLNATLHDPIVYPLALLKDASPGAQAFYNYLQTDRAAVLFAAQGFIVNGR